MVSLPAGVDPSTIPLLPNPNGDLPNFVDPPSLVTAVLGTGIALIALSAIVVILRVGTNIKSQRGPGIDDWLCIVAEVLAISYWALELKFAQVAGRHGWDIPISAVFQKSFIQKAAIQQIIAGPTFFACKAAILTLYLRLFSSLQWFRNTSYVLLVFIFCLCMSNVVVAAVLCAPAPGGSWDAALFARCQKTAPSAPVLGALGLATDIIIFAMPLPIVSRLNLPHKKKIGLVVVFAIGFFAVVASAISLAYRVEAFRGRDATWNGVNAIITAFTDVFCTIIVSCAPALSSFWTNIFTETRLYSILLTGIRSRTTLSNASTGGKSQRAEKSSTGSGSSSRFRRAREYDEIDLTVGKLGSSHTAVYSSQDTHIPLRDGIVTSTTIDQISQQGW